MFTQERLRSVLIKFLDRDCGSIFRQELASELECTRDDVVNNEEMVKYTLV